jgi:hypothetical protein
MEPLVMLFALVIGFIGLDLAVTRWGVDSRVQIPDDRRR